ncbi:PD-(D/E)XK nuclease superfamily protein [Candidatus Methanophagaceae archaeon]|nr:PD-(D/E)XK nuclease superfamily protein [Methanophagales archaeon]
MQERIKIDNWTPMHADKPDFRYTELTEAIIRLFYRVYNKQGYGFLEKVYEIAMVIELNFGTNPEVKRKAFDFLRKSA